MYCVDSVKMESHDTSRESGVLTQLVSGPLQRSGLTVLLLAGIGALTAMSLVSNFLWLRDVPRAEEMRALFCVDEEMSLPTWWSAMTLAGLGVLSWITAQSRASEGLVSRLAWRGLAGGFLFLSMDELCKLHERFGSLVPLDGAFTHARWMILWLPLGVGVGGVVLIALWRSSPRAVKGIVVGAAVFLGGAVGIETGNAYTRHQAEARAEAVIETGAALEGGSVDRTGKRNVAYIGGTALEELLEMMGVFVWYMVLWGVWAERSGAFRAAGAASRTSRRPSVVPDRG